MHNLSCAKRGYYCVYLHQILKVFAFATVFQRAVRFVVLGVLQGDSNLKLLATGADRGPCLQLLVSQLDDNCGGGGQRGSMTALLKPPVLIQHLGDLNICALPGAIPFCFFSF